MTKIINIEVENCEDCLACRYYPEMNAFRCKLTGSYIEWNEVKGIKDNCPLPQAPICKELLGRDKEVAKITKKLMEKVDTNAYKELNRLRKENIHKNDPK